MCYQLIIRLLSPLILFLTIKDALKYQGGWSFFKQRLGLFYPKLTPSPKRIWLHCASVGEVNAAVPLIRAIQSRYDILITTNTPTGQQQVKSLFADSVQHCYLPVDWPYAIRCFLTHCQPTDCWILETEIWPNLYQQCALKRIPLSIVNARLSNKTLNAPSWLKVAYQKCLPTVTHVLASSIEEAKRYIQLGVTPSKISTLGNLKYAQAQKVTTADSPINRPYVLLASSHSNEELMISQTWLALQRPELLVIVPRHAKRGSAIRQQLLELNKNLKVASLGERPDKDSRLFLDDRLGKLMPLFEHAELVIMGGSFVSKGGHNLLEPVAYQKAIITGPDMSDFQAETQWLKDHNGIIQCIDYQALSDAIQSLMANKKQCLQLGQNALKAVYLQTGILEKYLDKLLKAPTLSKII